MQHDIDAMDRELKRPELRRGILKELGQSVRTVLEGAIGSLLATEVQPSIHKAIEVISSIDWSQLT